VIEDVRLGIEDARHGRHVAVEIRRQHFYSCVRQGTPDSLTVSAKCREPPSARSSRFTLVITT